MCCVGCCGQFKVRCHCENPPKVDVLLVQSASKSSRKRLRCCSFTFEKKAILVRGGFWVNYPVLHHHHYHRQQDCEENTNKLMI
ncbi:hypothetical protein QR98_0022640 [Sarcoptes scabiei]|uniref:Uncharacterized protein n=1 Tax=Sarcoptes scabiei TaxID=52283 RepID=A0A131ZZ87_SARSC|nr:hypothetical protein QR98_0022640 [Sarcoptes scabiei]